MKSLKNILNILFENTYEKVIAGLILLLAICFTTIMTMWTTHSIDNYIRECEFKGGHPVIGNGIHLCLDPKVFIK